MVVKMKKIGGSLALVIPKALAAELMFTAGTTVDVTAGPEGLTVRRSGRRPRRSTAEIVKGMKASNYTPEKHAPFDDEPVGREVW